MYEQFSRIMEIIQKLLDFCGVLFCSANLSKHRYRIALCWRRIQKKRNSVGCVLGTWKVV